MKYTLFLAFLLLISCNTRKYDICIYGGTSSGVVAAYTAAQYGKKVILISPTTHLGGLSSGGLGATDIGNKYAITGVARDFYRELGKHYGKLENWTFEPKVAEKVFDNWASHPNITILKSKYLYELIKEGSEIESIMVGDVDGNERVSISAKIFMDCTYEGDLLDKSEVSYTIGREGNSLYKETLNGYQMFQDRFFGNIEMGRNYHQFPDSIDPYVIKGEPKSGLLYGINGTTSENGKGDTLLQAYNFRLCLTKNKENKVSFSVPSNYVADNYELLRRVFERKSGQEISIDDCLLIIDMPNGKTDVNNRGPMSTDFIGKNHAYPKMSYKERLSLEREHRQYIEGLLYFLSTDSGVPENLRNQVSEYGWAKDEFTDNGYFPYQLYVREGRRMQSDYVMTEHNCRKTEVVDDAIAMAAYTMDSHHTQRLVVNGMVKNEGDVQVFAGPPYDIAYRSIVPRKNECTNLLVPVCLSASHIAYGSIRMEPVFMVLGQSAAVAAVQAINNKLKIQNIDIKQLQQELSNNPYVDGRIPDILIDDTDSTCEKYYGDWIHHSWGYKYGYIETDSKDAVIMVTPKVLSKGRYKIYLFKSYPQSDILSGKLYISDNIKEFEINTKGINYDWIEIDELDLDPSLPFKLQLNNSGNTVYFDALLCVSVDKTK